MRFTCYYPGLFNPPTIDHIETARQLSNHQDVDKVVILIGNSDKGISQDEIAEMWKEMTSSEPAGKMEIQKVEKPALNHLYDELDEKPETPMYIAVDQKSGEHPEFNDRFARFPNIEIKLIDSQYNDTSDKLMKALHSQDESEIRKYVPHSMKKHDLQRMMGRFKPKKDEPPVEEKSPFIISKDEEKDLYEMLKNKLKDIKI